MPIATALPLVIEGITVLLSALQHGTEVYRAIQAANAEGRDLTDDEVASVKRFNEMVAEPGWAAQLARLRAEQTGEQQ